VQNNKEYHGKDKTNYGLNPTEEQIEDLLQGLRKYQIVRTY
jgi:hypothetical protein